MMRRSIAVTLIVAMTWMSTWAAAPGWAQEPSRPEPNFEEAMARLDSFMSIVKEIRAGIDRGRFDLDALIEELDYDDGEIVRFVTEEIHFEPYQGLLRGARGTLMSGSGNSLDQAVLLATLLKDAGYEARISRGELSRKQAERLLMTAASPRSARASPAIPLEVRKQLERMSELTGTSLNSIGAVSTDSKAQLPVTTAGEIDVKIEATGDALLASLEDAGIILAPRDTHQELVSDTTEYFWVDYRTGPATPWTSCHAAFGATQDSLVPPDPTQTFTTSVPPEFQHRVRLELFLEQEALGKKTTHTLMDPWERPAANMHGRTISLHFMPSTVVGPGGLASSLRDPESFGVLTPMVNNVLPSGAMAFNSRGFLVDPSVTESAAAGVFGEVGNAFGDAAGALSGWGQPKILTARQASASAQCGSSSH